jgi:hypothetical protein
VVHKEDSDSPGSFRGSLEVALDIVAREEARRLPLVADGRKQSSRVADTLAAVGNAYSAMAIVRDTLDVGLGNTDTDVVVGCAWDLADSHFGNCTVGGMVLEAERACILGMSWGLALLVECCFAREQSILDTCLSLVECDVAEDLLMDAPGLMSR